MGMCSRCGCCSTRNGECVGPCTPCGHHPIDECPNCEDKDREIAKLRDFIADIEAGARNLRY